MATLELNHVYKVYPNGMKAVNDFSMKVEDKEFIVFVGPSGCGKSTTLRMIAGLEEITSGDIRIDGQIVNDVEPKERDIAMVFQNYALYPHMTVYNNIAFGLKLKHLPKDVIDQKVKEAAAILGLTEYLNRKPKAMSGGQRQRVALGRAIVREPKIFLLDEPLSNLDAKLRASMRNEISKLHNKLKTTFVYVTHDQVEAMTLGTRVVVMKDGYVQQIDTPRNIYRFPVNKFVAGFIGTPQMNFFKGKMLRKGDKVKIEFDVPGNSFEAPISLFRKMDPSYLNGDKEVIFGLRSEHISIEPKKYDWKTKIKVSHIEELGVETQIYGDLNLHDDSVLGNEGTSIILKAPTGTEYRPGSIIDVSLGLSHLKIFDAETEINVNPRLPSKISAACSIEGGYLHLYKNKIRLPSVFSYEPGNYIVEFPTSALSVGKGIEAKIVEKDVLGEQVVYVLESDGDFLYYVAGQDVDYNIGETIEVHLDLKRCHFYNEEREYKAMDLSNSVKAKVIDNPIMVEHHDENGKPYSRKEHYCTLDIFGHILPTSKELGFNLLSLREKKVFKEFIEAHFGPYDVAFTEVKDGIACQVNDVIELDGEFLNVVDVQGTRLLVASKERVALGENKIKIDLAHAAFYSEGKDIRLA